LPNIILGHAALGGDDRNIGLTTADENGKPLGGASYISANGNELTRQVRLDDTVPAERKISVIHFDLEGYEAEALKGAEATIRRDRPVVILETVPEDFASRFGYVFDRTIDENSAFRPL
jgi:FkbM family methyltransferase